MQKRRRSGNWKPAKRILDDTQQVASRDVISMNRKVSFYLLTAAVACAIAIVLRQSVYLNADWWNPVMIGLLVAALVAHVWRNRTRGP
jgi:1,4-dihydroxy-2-naphthoate octaprenyltransferase